MKNIHEGMTRFFENPTREKFRELIQFNTGEYDNLDFKKEWPETTKLAKHVLAFSNSGGGVIVIGVEESEEKQLSSVGIDSIQDKATISMQLKPYIPSNVSYEVLDFSYKSSEYKDLVGKSFQVILIEYDPTIIPVVCMKEGKNVRENAIYVREGTSSVIASYDYLQRILNNRISTNRNTSNDIKIEEHLAQLEILYTNIKKYNYVYKSNDNGMENALLTFGRMTASLVNNILGEKEAVKNPNYPEEDYEQFICRVISLKKKRIENLLDI